MLLFKSPHSPEELTVSYDDSQCQLYIVEAPIWGNVRGILAYQFSYSPSSGSQGGSYLQSYACSSQC